MDEFAHIFDNNYGYGEPTADYDLNGIDIDNLPLKAIETTTVKRLDGIDIKTPAPKVNGIISLNNEKKLSDYLFRNELETAEALPPLEPLYYEAIFEGDLHLLSGDTGIGKSIFAIQLAKQFSETKRILYFDFEMSNRNHLKRYPVKSQFNDNFFIKFGREVFENTEVFDYDYLVKDVEFFKPSIIFIDNIVGLLASGSTLQDPSIMIKLVKDLKRLKDTFDLTILLLAHINKADTSKGLNRNMITGSKVIQNLLDSLSMMGRYEEQRYLKIVKNRNGTEYPEVLQLEFVTDGNLHFKEAGWVLEADLLKGEAQPRNNKDLQDVTAYIFSTNKEMFYTEILNELTKLGHGESKAKKMITEMTRFNYITKNENKSYSLNIDNEPF